MLDSSVVSRKNARLKSLDERHRLVQVSRRVTKLGSKYRDKEKSWFNSHGARECTLSPHTRHTLGTLSALAPLLRRGRVEKLGGVRGREVRYALHQSDIKRQPLDVNTSRHQFFVGKKRAMHQSQVKRQPNGRKNHSLCVLHVREVRLALQ